MTSNNILDNVALRARQMESGLRSLSARYPFMADVRGRGLLWGFEFVTDPVARTPPDPALAANMRFVANCFAARLNVYPAGIAPFNNAALLAPPLTISEPEVDDLLSRLEEGLVSFAKEFGLSK